MGASAASAAAFYRDVAKTAEVWAIRDADGFPAPPNGSGQRSMPFWSSRSRALLIIRRVKAYSEFHPVPLRLDSFLEDWLPRGWRKTGCSWV